MEGHSSFAREDEQLTSRAQDTKYSAEEIEKYTRRLGDLVELLGTGSRRERQQAAKIISFISKGNAEIVVPYANDLVDALDVPEAQTRWEVLDALTNVVAFDSRTCDKAVNGAEMALFDEDSGPLRLAAMRFLCKLGSTTENRSEKVWPLIDEAIQCYHGDLEFQDMLLAVIDFSTGKISDSVKEGLAARMRFDAENSKGALKKRAALILENATR